MSHIASQIIQSFFECMIWLFSLVGILLVHAYQFLSSANGAISEIIGAAVGFIGGGVFVYCLENAREKSKAETEALNLINKSKIELAIIISKSYVQLESYLIPALKLLINLDINRINNKPLQGTIDLSPLITTYPALGLNFDLNHTAICSIYPHEPGLALRFIELAETIHEARSFTTNLNELVTQSRTDQSAILFHLGLNELPNGTNSFILRDSIFALHRSMTYLLHYSLYLNDKINTTRAAPFTKHTRKLIHYNVTPINKTNVETALAEAKALDIKFCEINSIPKPNYL